MAKQLARIAGYYLIGVALAIGAQFILEMTYESAAITPREVWFVLDWFSLVGFAICVYANFRYKQQSRGNQDVTWERMASNTAFYISIGLALAFLHNFVGNLAGGKDDLLFWKFINAVQVPLFLATGWRMSTQG